MEPDSRDSQSSGSPSTCDRKVDGTAYLSAQHLTSTPSRVLWYEHILHPAVVKRRPQDGTCLDRDYRSGFGALTVLSNNLLVVLLSQPVWHRLEAAGADEMEALRGTVVLLRCCWWNAGKSQTCSSTVSCCMPFVLSLTMKFVGIKTQHSYTQLRNDQRMWRVVLLLAWLLPPHSVEVQAVELEN